MSFIYGLPNRSSILITAVLVRGDERLGPVLEMHSKRQPSEEPDQDFRIRVIDFEDDPVEWPIF